VAEVTGSPVRARRTLILALAAIAAVFVVENVVASLYRANAKAEIRQQSRESLMRVELVGRIEHDLDEEKIVVDEHVAATSVPLMVALEEHLGELRADLSLAMAAYEALASDAVDQVAWLSMLGSIRRFQAAGDLVLDLSRDNPAERPSTDLVTHEFANLERAENSVLALDHARLRAASTQQAAIHESIARIMLVCRIAGLLGLVAVGWWGFSRVAREEQQANELGLLARRNAELDAFAGRVAHDLRNPLGTILFTTEQLAHTATPANQPMVDRLRRGSRRISTLIDDLLTLSRSGFVTEGQCNPATAVARVSEDFAERFGDEASLRHDMEPADVPYSEALLHQAIWNLVENGVKYRRAEALPELHITGHTSPQGYLLRVTDNGMGMSTDEVGHVFEPFYRTPSARSVGGTGLGLAIVKRVVEARGGSVSVESQTGVGTTFVLVLPLATAAR
jgi:signal transduction histidine kinase